MRLPNHGNKASHMHQLFSSIADHYDLLNSLLSFGRDKHWRRFTVSQAEPKPLETALDVATGTGELALELARQMKGSGRVLGVDLCQEMLDKARDKVKKKGYQGTIEFALGKAESLPYSDNLFDCAVIGFALRNVTDIRATFQEMNRVVKPGGKVISLELTHPAHKLLRQLYYSYFFHIAPRVGGLISGKKEEYVYLPHSLLDLPSSHRIKQIMEEVGLESVSIRYLTLGIVAVHIGIKRSHQ